jgi:hypothetical protein
VGKTRQQQLSTRPEVPLMRYTQIIENPRFGYKDNPIKFDRVWFGAPFS